MHQPTAFVTRGEEGGVADRPRAALREESAPLAAALEGRYALMRELGCGATAVVYLARDLVLERLVAIKTLHAHFDVPRLRARFLDEARMVAALVHPSIVPIYTVEQLGNAAFFVMPYVVGETLAHRVREAGPVGGAAALRIMRGVATALAFAHERGVVHRDVKPENIVLEHPTNRAMLLDFGISVRVQQGQECVTEALVGTPHFMSPEQAVGGAVDARSDLYSLGATMYFAVTGRPPFDGVAMHELLEQLRGSAAPRLSVVRPDLPPRLRATIECCLDKARSRRFASAGHVVEALKSRGAARGVERHGDGATPAPAAHVVLAGEKELDQDWD